MRRGLLCIRHFIENTYPASAVNIYHFSFVIPGKIYDIKIIISYAPFSLSVDNIYVVIFVTFIMFGMSLKYYMNGGLEDSDMSITFVYENGSFYHSGNNLRKHIK